MNRTPAEEFMAFAELGQNIVGLVKASGLGHAKRGRKPGSKNKSKVAAGGAKKKPGPKVKTKPAVPNGEADTIPQVGEGE